MQPYSPDAEALEAMKGGSGVSVTESKEWIVFEPRNGKQPDVLFYPGGLVRPESYAPLALSLAKEGYRTWIIRMPLNLAVLGIKRADKVIELLPEQTYVIGGHSLGGAMAARYASDNSGRLKGVFLLAAYADKKGSLRSTPLSVLSLVGSEDDVLNRQVFERGKVFLPEQTEYAEITGGNHAGFGSYGKQKGDNPALIAPDKQRSITVSLLVSWLERLEAK
ncbi:alpha/beta hydrolase [Paenibacillus sp. LMG 31456]|uniref:Alpha/beta hydrolase n=2 Tax=Paenibacillus foliorum TaxID=2654974 RepID=A0A972K268_9BACL|nr:alpha/beta hydrolase [Paenibacillus foliorum]